MVANRNGLPEQNMGLLLDGCWGGIITAPPASQPAIQQDIYRTRSIDSQTHIEWHPIGMFVRNVNATGAHINRITCPGCCYYKISLRPYTPPPPFLCFRGGRVKWDRKRERERWGTENAINIPFQAIIRRFMEIFFSLLNVRADNEDDDDDVLPKNSGKSKDLRIW